MTCGHTHFPLVAAHDDVTVLEQRHLDRVPALSVRGRSRATKCDWSTGRRTGKAGPRRSLRGAVAKRPGGIGRDAPIPLVQKSRIVVGCWRGHEFQRSSDDSRTLTEVSLDTDRLEQLLEVPAPAQPVVMIEYRNRGVPWWVLVPLVVLRPAGGGHCYYQSMVFETIPERQAADALPRPEVGDRAAAERTPSRVPPVQPVSEDARPGPGSSRALAQAVPAPPRTPAAQHQRFPSAARRSGRSRGRGASRSCTGEGKQQAEARVRSIFPMQLEPVGSCRQSEGGGREPSRRRRGSPVAPMRDDSLKTKVERPEEPRERAAPPVRGRRRPRQAIADRALADAGPRGRPPAGD